MAMWAQEQRPDLKLMVMSATLDAAKFSAFFPGARAAYVQVGSHVCLHCIARQGKYRHARQSV